MIGNKLAEETVRVLDLWLEQYHIPGDASREARPEIIAALRLKDEIRRGMAEMEVRYQIQVSTTSGLVWTNSQVPSHDTLHGAMLELSAVPAESSWLKYRIQPVISKDGSILYFTSDGEQFTLEDQVFIELTDVGQPRPL